MLTLCALGDAADRLGTGGQPAACRAQRAKVRKISRTCAKHMFEYDKLHTFRLERCKLTVCRYRKFNALINEVLVAKLQNSPSTQQRTDLAEFGLPQPQSPAAPAAPPADLASGDHAGKCPKNVKMSPDGMAAIEQLVSAEWN